MALSSGGITEEVFKKKILWPNPGLVRDKVGNGAQCCFDKLSRRLGCMLTCENHAESEKQKPREASQHQKAKGGILGKSTGRNGFRLKW